MYYGTARTGKWIDASTLKDGQKAKIVEETTKQTSKYKNPDGSEKVENVTRARFQGIEEPVNVRLNWTTIYGLIDAFGGESKNWCNHTLTVKTVDAMVGDTMRTLLYLIPEGYELVKNEEKKLVIKKVGTIGSAVEYPKDDINPDDIPF